MRHHFTRPAAATCTIVLLASACSDITEPLGDRRALGPSFSHGGPSETSCNNVAITGIHDNVTVPPGAECLITGAMILGNVKALEGSTLFMQAIGPAGVPSTVLGNIEGDRPDLLQIIDGSTVGNIFITGAGIDPPELGGPLTVSLHDITVTGGDVHILKTTANGIRISFVRVQKGSIKVEDNSVVGFGLHITANRVAQNLQVYKNQGDAAKIVIGNLVGENLQCFDNSPPVTGGGNFARNAEGQCSAAPLPPDFPIPIP